MHDWDEDNPWQINKDKYEHKKYYDSSHDNQCDCFEDEFEDHVDIPKKEHDFDCTPDQEVIVKILKILYVLKKEIDQCEKILLNPKYGLKEIKCEVKNIERAVFSPTFGLAEIKSEVSEILSIVSNLDVDIDIPITLLNDIKSEVSAIEAAVFNPTFGLLEIKSEVSTIQTIVEGIMDMIDNSTFGLEEIKSEVSAIQSTVNDIENIVLDIILNPTFGLSEIKAEVSNIESAVFNPTFGLLEIKSEINQLLNGTASTALTTGPFVLDCEEQILHLKAVNKTNSPQSVEFFLRDLSTCPPTQFRDLAFGAITPCCAVFNDIDISGFRRRNIEINVNRSNTGVLVYAATLTGTTNCPGRKVSEFRHAEWVPIATFCLTD